MIGGEDMILHGNTAGHEADLILRQFRATWPEARIQQADSDLVRSFNDVTFPVLTRDAEFFIFRDAETCRSWKVSGATEDNQSGMVHVIITDDSVTIVTDHIDSNLSAFSREMLDSISRNRILLTAA